MPAIQPWVKVFVVAGSAALGAAAGQALSVTATNQASIAEVDASIDRGSVFRLYYNNAWSEPQAVAIQPGRWTVYRFPVPSRLTALRLDPSDETGAEVLVRSVTIRSRDTSRSVTADQLQHWLRSDLEVWNDANAEVTHIMTGQRDAYMMGSVDIDLTRQTFPLLEHFHLDVITLLWCAFFLATVLLLLSIRMNDLPVAIGMALILLASVALAYGVSPRILAWPAPSPGVNLTIGHESFFGQSKAAELRATDGAIASAAVLALLLGWIVRRRVAGEASLPVSRQRLLLRRDVAFIAGCVLLFAAGSVPSAVVLHRLALASRHAVDFDSHSMLAWQYLYAHGSLPWRDYWFPYSGMYDQLAPLYPDIAIKWGHMMVLFAVLLTTGLAVTGYSRTAILALCAVWIYLEAMGIISPGASSRYCLSLSLVALGAVALNQRAAWPAAALGLWAAYVFREEISQIAYAAPGLGLLAAGSLLRPPGQSRLAVLHKLLTAAGAFGLGVTLFLLSLARHGQIGQWWEFTSSVDVMSNYSGWPADVASWFSAAGTMEQLLVLATIVLLIGGILQAVWTRFRDLYLVVPAALGCLSVMLLQKDVIRPGIEGQILLVPILGLALLTIQQLQLRPARYRPAAWMAFSAALLVSCFTWNVTTNRERVWGYLNVTSGLLPDLRYTLFAARKWAPAREWYFSPSSVTFSPMSGDELAARVLHLTGMGANDNIFVLGDNSDLYMVLRRPAAFYASLYNQSPLAGQRKTIAWLSDHDPKYLFWDPQEKVFDGVPNQVRVPLLYSHAVAHFVPLGTVGKFDVLRRRTPDEPPGLAYWRDKLGASLELGYIPATSPALSEVNDRGSHQMRYLIVRLLAPEEGAVYSVTLRLAGEPYVVHFNGRKGVTEYAIAVDRLPFAEAGDELGRPPVVESLPGGSVSARISTLRFAAERLY